MKKIVLTFDDGKLSHLDFVAPLLKQYNFGATFFINGRYADFQRDGVEFDYLGWEDVKKLEDMGFEIGSHCYNHVDITKQTYKFLLKDFQKLKDRFRQAGLSEPVSFAYPGFHYDGLTMRQLRQQGFKLARIGCSANLQDFTKGGTGRAWKSDDDKYEIPCLGVFGKSYNFSDAVKNYNQLQDDETGVFCFHGFKNNLSWHPVDISKETFTEFINFLVKNQCSVTSLKDAI
jgi:peptidoglycan/xylan/chitin deacetylase (PgdA/CDA1 family)